MGVRVFPAAEVLSETKKPTIRVGLGGRSSLQSSLGVNPEIKHFCLISQVQGPEIAFMPAASMVLKCMSVLTGIVSGYTLCRCTVLKLLSPKVLA